jgi:hypothetical protein
MRSTEALRRQIQRERDLMAQYVGGDIVTTTSTSFTATTAGSWTSTGTPTIVYNAVPIPPPQYPQHPDIPLMPMSDPLDDSDAT